MGHTEDDVERSDKILTRLLASETDIDEVFTRLDEARRASEKERARVVQAVVPGDVLDMSGEFTLDELLDSVLGEYEEIENVLQGLRESPEPESRNAHSDAVAFVSEHELANPSALVEALAPLQNDTARFEFLFDTARHALERLSEYRLSRRSPESLIAAMHEEDRVEAVRFLVEFLRSLQRAADSFEALEIPKPHVQDYLRHLYLMRDWSEMRRLVQVLEMAVTTTLGKTIDELNEEKGVSPSAEP